jgi:hypothetical protein
MTGKTQGLQRDSSLRELRSEWLGWLWCGGKREGRRARRLAQHYKVDRNDGSSVDSWVVVG